MPSLAYIEGFVHYNGEFSGLCDCPYPSGSIEANEWLRGFRWAILVKKG